MPKTTQDKKGLPRECVATNVFPACRKQISNKQAPSEPLELELTFWRFQARSRLRKCAEYSKNQERIFIKNDLVDVLMNFNPENYDGNVWFLVTKTKSGTKKLWKRKWCELRDKISIVPGTVLTTKYPVVQVGYVSDDTTWKQYYTAPKTLCYCVRLDPTTDATDIWVEKPSTPQQQQPQPAAKPPASTLPALTLKSPPQQQPLMTPLMTMQQDASAQQQQQQHNAQSCECCGDSGSHLVLQNQEINTFYAQNGSNQIPSLEPVQKIKQKRQLSQLSQQHQQQLCQQQQQIHSMSPCQMMPQRALPPLSSPLAACSSQPQSQVIHSPHAQMQIPLPFILSSELPPNVSVAPLNTFSTFAAQHNNIDHHFHHLYNHQNYHLNSNDIDIKSAEFNDFSIDHPLDGFDTFTIDGDVPPPSSSSSSLAEKECVFTNFANNNNNNNIYTIAHNNIDVTNRHPFSSTNSFIVGDNGMLLNTAGNNIIAQNTNSGNNNNNNNSIIINNNSSSSNNGSICGMSQYMGIAGGGECYGMSQAHTFMTGNINGINGIAAGGNVICQSNRESPSFINLPDEPVDQDDGSESLFSEAYFDDEENDDCDLCGGYSRGFGMFYGNNHHM